MDNQIINDTTMDIPIKKKRGRKKMEIKKPKWIPTDADPISYNANGDIILYCKNY